MRSRTSGGSSVALELNEIGDEGMQGDADKLPGSSVTTLNLWENVIGDEGCKAIADKHPVDRPMSAPPNLGSASATREVAAAASRARRCGAFLHYDRRRGQGGATAAAEATGCNLHV